MLDLNLILLFPAPNSSALVSGYSCWIALNDFLCFLVEIVVFWEDTPENAPEKGKLPEDIACTALLLLLCPWNESVYCFELFLTEIGVSDSIFWSNRFSLFGEFDFKVRLAWLELLRFYLCKYIYYCSLESFLRDLLEKLINVLLIIPCCCCGCPNWIY